MSSDYDYMSKVRLPNWGRWGRQDSTRPDPERGSSSIYGLGGKDERDLDPDAAPEPPAPRIDHADAEFLDNLITNRIALEHRHVICGYFYKRYGSFHNMVPAAIRALLDAEEALQGKGNGLLPR